MLKCNRIPIAGKSMIKKGENAMDWWGIALIVLIVVGLIVFQALTGAGSAFNCTTGRMAVRKMRLKDKRDVSAETEGNSEQNKD